MQSNIFVLLVGIVFLVFGLALLLLPFDVLRRYDRATGTIIIKQAPDEATGLRRARWFYRLLGITSLFLAIMNLTIVWPIPIQIGNTDEKIPPTEIYVDWLWSLSVRETDSGSLSPARAMPVFPKGTKRVFLAFFTPSQAGRTLQYQWTANGELQKEFEYQEKNGRNYIELSKPDSASLPSGSHEVTISLNGGRVAVARFRVE